MADYTLNTNQTSCLDILGTQVGIFIQQKFEFFQVMIGFQTPNVFKVYAANDQGEQIEQKELFKCKEKSSSCARLTLRQPLFQHQVHPFDHLRCLSAIMGAKTSNLIWIKCSRKTLIALFSNLIESMYVFMNVQYVENGQNRNLGYIVNPFYCCTLGCHIFDSENKLKYIIEGSCCQCYFWCRFPCSEQCNHVEFHIKTPNGEVVAPMNKQVKGCCQNWADFTGNNSVVFPQNASKEDKALILAATILFEYMYFENKDGPQPVN
ncbi:unnamed protein product (macronuclear) [Paramecium tetraurelia]|uniref:Phospholipid scramblase n=1 Tax=Paramecium tetraurelia TaxID=5888 RepID=A0C8M1_PARTE|nr:uncharacterized protein GSPATT00036272001 [Paramecium tetraurelia]CAK67138.1 unnamed protein product [Paramecium tetraurelia]|eukprot:XP_001434535.1 hypothetical protein (macronuclear) [Paramecium tetraurelia strain d4-2]